MCEARRHSRRLRNCILARTGHRWDRSHSRACARSFGDGTVAVKDVSLQIDSGEFVVFVGPSGCGKSTLLRMIAGLERISDGEVRIDGRVINDMPPRERDVAMVFQNYALYPHMSVRENIGFALEQRRIVARGDRPAGQRGRAHPRSQPAARIAGPSSFPAASANAWRWAALSCVIRRRSCSTSRYPISTPSCACRCAPNLVGFIPALASPRSTSPTTRSRR